MCHCILRASQQRVFCRFHASLIRTLIGHDLSFFNYQALLLAAADTCM